MVPKSDYTRLLQLHHIQVALLLRTKQKNVDRARQFECADRSTTASERSGAFAAKKTAATSSCRVLRKCSTPRAQQFSVMSFHPRVDVVATAGGPINEHVT